MSWSGAFDCQFCPRGSVSAHNDCLGGGGGLFAVMSERLGIWNSYSVQTIVFIILNSYSIEIIVFIVLGTTYDLFPIEIGKFGQAMAIMVRLLSKALLWGVSWQFILGGWLMMKLIVVLVRDFRT